MYVIGRTFLALSHSFCQRKMKLNHKWFFFCLWVMCLIVDSNGRRKKKHKNRSNHKPELNYSHSFVSSTWKCDRARTPKYVATRSPLHFLGQIHDAYCCWLAVFGFARFARLFSDSKVLGILFVLFVLCVLALRCFDCFSFFYAWNAVVTGFDLVGWLVCFSLALEPLLPSSMNRIYYKYQPLDGISYGFSYCIWMYSYSMSWSLLIWIYLCGQFIDVIEEARMRRRDSFPFCFHQLHAFLFQCYAAFFFRVCYSRQSISQKENWNTVIDLTLNSKPISTNE